MCVQVFVGALSAMAFMTVLSCVLGAIADSFVPAAYTKIAAALLFLFFGVHTLMSTLVPDALDDIAAVVMNMMMMGKGKSSSSSSSLSPSAESEKKKVKKTNSTKSSNGCSSGKKASEIGGSSPDTPASPRGKVSAMEEELRAAEREVAASSGAVGGTGSGNGWKETLVGLCGDAVVIESFAMSFFAEWGDRSQIATIGLAASNSIVGVTLGGILGHAMCTGLAVLCGRHLAKYVSERTLGITGGCLFLLFGVQAMFL